MYDNGVHGIKIGGNSAKLPVQDHSVDLMTLHNSIEHLEGNADSKFIEECVRALKKSGEVTILPIFLEKEHINYINPTCNPKNLLVDREAKKIFVYGHPRFMRHYSAETFKARILKPSQGEFKIDLFRIIVSEDFQETIELALALRLTKL